MKTAVRRVVDAMTGIVREMDEAQHLGLALQTAMDRYVPNPDAGPDTYAEFLARTSGVLLREPSARQRARRSRRGGS